MTLPLEDYLAAQEGTQAEGQVTEDGDLESDEDAEWLKLVVESRQSAESFLNSSLRRQWEQNYALFNNRHPPGSKYHSELYKKRSRLFRPRTRSTVRKNEAAAAAAFFSSTKLTSVEATDDNDPKQLASAAINEHLLQYRLTKTIPWFLTLIGALQDAQVTGVCCSKQYWRYQRREVTTWVPMLDPETGQPVMDPATGHPLERPEPGYKVVQDKPCIDVIPPENVLIDPGADWRDPANTSPYLILLIPMYVHEVRERIANPDSKTGAPGWRPVSDADLGQAMSGMSDSVRAAREGQERQDSKSNDAQAVRDYDIVWVQENFIKRAGTDYVFFTLGGHAILSDPRPVDEVYWHCEEGKRPIVMGSAVIETHKVYPSSKVQLTAPLQVEINDVTNQRMDNVKLAMNGRNFVRNGGNVDLQALLRSTPGGTVLMQNPGTDVVTDRPPDVTASSYQEQDRLSVEFDEAAGAFSPASIQSNRKLNETVGGMQLLAGNASGMAEYDLRVFTETWVEPVLRQLLRLEQKYESDVVVLSLAGAKAKLWQHFGVNRIDDELLEQDLTCTVDVGLAAVAPERRLARFEMATKTVGQIFGPSIVKRVKQDAVISEVFGLAGYRDGSRFFNPEEEGQAGQEQIEQLQSVIQDLQKQLDDKNREIDAKIQIAQGNNATDIAVQQLQNEGDYREHLLVAQKPTKFDWPGLPPAWLGTVPQGRPTEAQPQGRAPLARGPMGDPT